MMNYEELDLFKEYITGKSVFLVGPSPSIIGQGMGTMIDEFDVVVRMNKAVPVPNELASDIGTKTDVLYNCLEPHPNSGGVINPVMWKENGVKWICSPYPYLSFTAHNIDQFEKKNLNNAKIPFRMVDMAIYKQLAEATETRPNTGLLAICDLLQFDIKELFIAGMTFGQDGYYKQYNDMPLERYLKMANGPHHKQLPQFEHFRTIFQEDKRIVPDSALANMLMPF